MTQFHTRSYVKVREYTPPPPFEEEEEASKVGEEVDEKADEVESKTQDSLSDTTMLDPSCYL